MKFYITTSIAYTNAPPHIGFALELAQADVLARYHRLRGDNVYFLTGTDENGIKNKKTAEELGITSQKLVDRNSVLVKKLTQRLNISNNDFIRTTDKMRHWPVVQKIWQKLEKNGDIYKKEYEGLYCSGCEAFVTKKDLDNQGRCRIHKKRPEKIKEENYFFRLSKYEKRLQNTIKAGELKIIPEARKKELLNFIKDGIQDVSFSRPASSLDWGIPVPNDPSQTIYVWADALTNYVSALGYGTQNLSNFKLYWPADIHLIGKDILRFHALMWPGILISLGLPLPKTLLVHGFITSDGQKMSKTLGNVVSPFDLIQKYGTDALRYYLLREIPTLGDGDFTRGKFQERYSSDLANGLGNLSSRILKMVEKYSGAKVPQIKKDPNNSPLKNNNKIYNRKKSWKDLDKNVRAYRIDSALISIWKFISEIDKYIEQTKPWQLAKEGKKEELDWVLYVLLDSLHQLAWQIYPFLPKTSFKLAKALEIKNLLVKNPLYKKRSAGIKQGIKINPMKPLFPKPI